jgi:hypothetical protein
MRKRLSAPICALTFTASMLMGEVADAELIDLPADVSLKPVRVSIDDTVDEGCWTNSEDVEATVTLPLRQSGVLFTERTEIGDLKLFISALGGRAKSGLCFGVLSIELSQVDVEEYPDGSWIHEKRIAMYQTVAVAGDKLDSQFVEFSDSTGKKFANMILAARQPKLDD